MSSSTRSGWCSAQACSASRPSPASATTSTPALLGQQVRAGARAPAVRRRRSALSRSDLLLERDPKLSQIVALVPVSGQRGPSGRTHKPADGAMEVAHGALPRRPGWVRRQRSRRVPAAAGAGLWTRICSPSALAGRVRCRSCRPPAGAKCRAARRFRPAAAAPGAACGSARAASRRSRQRDLQALAEAQLLDRQVALGQFDSPRPGVESPSPAPSAARNRSDRSSTARSATSGSRRTRPAMVFMLLNRKCGLIRACSASASARALARTCALPAVADVEVAQHHADDQRRRSPRCRR